MRILVTGAAGFIGGHVVERLLSGGHDLLVAATKPERVPAAWQVQTITFGDAHGGLEEAAVRRFGPDALLHVAWAGIPNLDVTWSLVNVGIAARVIAVSLACGVTRVVGVGSCREYPPGGGAKKESDAPAEIADIFGQAKTSTRHLLRAASERCGTEWRWARPFYVYGPGQRPDALIPSAIREARRGRQLDVASPRAAVDFVNVADVADALSLLTTRPGPSGPFNIGSGQAANVASVASWVRQEWLGESGGDIRIGSGPEAWWADTTSITADYGWTPTVSLENGIRHLIDKERA